MKEEQKLIYIPVEDLYPHPDNPRKDLGDLSELTESIRENGVMQNLTVVPHTEYSGKYTVIIGHRRTEAAKRAGVTHLPCVVVNMTPQEQVSTMLMENIQRSDLSVYEQAQGFQMMLDLGETVASISKKTGMSQTSVRKRVKMAELDQKTLEKVSGRQISLTDFDRLAKVEDLETRNKLLKDIGTNNFENRLNVAMREQDNKKTREALLKEFERRGYKPIAEYTLSAPTTMEAYIDSEAGFSKLDGLRTDIVHYYEEMSWGSGFRIYKCLDEEKTAEELRADRIREAKREWNEKINDAFRRAYQLRYSFIKNFPKSDAKKHMKTIAAFIIQKNWAEYGYSSYSCKKFCEFMGIKTDEDFTIDYDVIASSVAQNTEYSLLVQAYVSYDDGENNRFANWNGEYKANEKLSRLYAILCMLGYEMSDEERKLMDGTSELYVPIDESAF